MCGRYKRRSDKQRIAETFHAAVDLSELYLAPDDDIIYRYRTDDRREAAEEYVGQAYRRQPGGRSPQRVSGGQWLFRCKSLAHEELL